MGRDPLRCVVCGLSNDSATDVCHSCQNEAEYERYRDNERAKEQEAASEEWLRNWSWAQERYDDARGGYFG